MDLKWDVKMLTGFIWTSAGFSEQWKDETSGFTKYSNFLRW
jgi:hypothetical protein